MVWEESKNEREINKESRARGWKRGEKGRQEGRGEEWRDGETREEG